MEGALSALRRLSAGVGEEADVFRAASAASLSSVGEDPGTVGTPEDDDTGQPPEDGTGHFIGGVVRRGPGEEGGQQVSELYTWGRTQNYQLGFGAHGEEQPVPRWVHLPEGIDITSISCGRFHSAAVTVSGHVLCWGFGGATNRLGLEASDVATGASSCVVEPTPLPEFGPGRHEATKVAAGLGHTLALTSAGRVLAWGSNADGQLGLPGISTSCRPQVVKGTLKAEEAKDIAAGIAHSLCTVASGAAFAWGSNAFGSLGLGVPPAGPESVPTPQQMPHLRGVCGLAASASSHVSIALAQHGDAVIFGAPHDKRSGASATRGSNAMDAKFFAPHRVRRREPTVLPGMVGVDEWQIQRSGGGAPLQHVVMSAEEAFAVDSLGSIWVWSLQGQRPCYGEALMFRATPPVPRQGFRCIAVTDSSNTLWAVDATEGAGLWRLRREADSWRAEPYDHLAQVSCLSCGPDHQAVVVTYERPLRALPAAPQEEVTKKDVADDEDDDLSPEDLEREESQAAAAAVVRQPRSLQQICEDRLCQSLSPRTFGVACEIAWELRRPVLLDRVFAFFQANAPLLFSRLHLPTLSQLPFGLLAAFELTSTGRLTAASVALESCPPDAFIPEEWLAAAPPDSQAACTALETGSAAAGSRRRRRKDAGAGSSPNMPKASPPAQPSSTAASPQVQPSALASPISASLPPPAAASPNMGPLPSPAASPSWAAAVQRNTSSPALAKAAHSSPLLGAGQMLPAPSVPLPSSRQSPPSQPSDWVEVRGRRKSGASGSGGSPEFKSAASPKTSPLPPVTSSAGSASPLVKAAASPKVNAVKPAPTQTFSIADYLRIKANIKRAVSAAADSDPAHLGKAAGAGAGLGPSAILSAAVQSMQEAGDVSSADWRAKQGGRPWGDALEGAAEPLPSLREIIEEEGSSSRGPVPGTSVSFSKAGTASDPTCNSWGRDAMPSAQPKGQSVYAIQEQQEVENAQRKVDEEIQDIEAMFEALEIAERAEEMERLGIAPPQPQAPAPGPGQRSRRGGGKGGAGRGRGRGAKGEHGSKKPGEQGGARRQPWWREDQGWEEGGGAGRAPRRSKQSGGAGKSGRWVQKEGQAQGEVQNGTSS